MEISSGDEACRRIHDFDENMCIARELTFGDNATEWRWMCGVCTGRYPDTQRVIDN